jgi:lipopolysaccharide export system permease protein
MFAVLDRYILKELIGPFLFSVGLCSSVGVTAGVMFELVRKVTEAGLPFSTAVQVFLLKMPDFIVLAFPMAMVLATLMVYSRMSSDSEIVAMRSCGISIYRLVIPALILSLFATALTFLFNEIIVPNANYQAAVTLDSAAREEIPKFQREHIIYPEFGKVRIINNPEDPDDDKTESRLVRIFYAENYDGKTMNGVTIMDRSQTDLDQIVLAESASWNPTEKTWDLYNGTIYLISPDGSYRNILRFQKQNIQLPRTPLDLANKRRTFSEMNIAEATEYLNLMKESGNQERIIKTQVRIQQKYSLPFVCVVFGLIGAALGTHHRSKGKATSFALSVVVIFAYYIMAFIMGAMGIKGIITPFMSAWIPTIAGLIVAGFLLFKASSR